MNVKERADAIGTFRYIEVRLMEAAAYWVPLTPEMEVKVLLGRHIWDFAQHADWLGKRTYELRQPEHYTRKAANEYIAVLDSLGSARTTEDKLAMLYDVVVPGLMRHYQSYISATDALLDAPSVVIIERIVTDLARQVVEAKQLRDEIRVGAGAIAPFRDTEAAISSVVA